MCCKAASALARLKIRTMSRLLDSEDVFADWRVDTIWRYVCENDLDDNIDEDDVAKLVEKVERAPVAFVFADSIDQDPPVPYWSHKDVVSDCAIYKEDGFDPIITLALRTDQMCEFLSALFNTVD